VLIRRKFWSLNHTYYIYTSNTTNKKFVTKNILNRGNAWQGGADLKPEGRGFYQVLDPGSPKLSDFLFVLSDVSYFIHTYFVHHHAPRGSMKTTPSGFDFEPL